MIQEFTTPTFYPLDNITIIYYALQITFEKYICANIFRGDLTRILFASNDYAFRARYEQQDRSTSYDGASSLRLPFANYWYEGYFEPDDRTASRNTWQSLVGIVDGQYQIRSRPVKAVLTSTFYFSADAEARVAYDNLKWLFVPRSVILASEVRFRNTVIPLPFVLDLENIQFNPSFNESQWLKNNRIIPFTANFSVRTYLLNPVKFDPIPSGVPSTISDVEPVYLVEESLLYFFSEKGMLTSTIPTGSVANLAVSAYFNPSYDIVINNVQIVGTPGYDRVEISWDLSIPTTAELDSLSQIVFVVSGQPQSITINNPPLIGSHTITGLSELSNYTVHIYFRLKSNKVKAQNLSFVTAKNPATDSPRGLKGINQLKGLTF